MPAIQVRSCCVPADMEESLCILNTIGECSKLIDLSSQASLKKTITDCIRADQGMLDALRAEIRPLRDSTRKIQPRAVTSISLVGTDGGNNQLRFDPFMVQLVRVVDSSNNEYCLEALSPSTPIDSLTARQFNSDGSPCTALGKMMAFLDVKTLPHLSRMIRPVEDGQPASSNWVRVYRELVEWATLFTLLEKDFATDTVIVYDGLLRSLVFADDLFTQLLRGMEERVSAQWSRSRRRLYLAGVAKHSKVLDRYRLAMALEGVLQTNYEAYVQVPPDIEERAYFWPDYALGDDSIAEGTRTNRSVGGQMFLVKFGNRPHDPVWPVDIFRSQVGDTQAILGSITQDACNGFPVPFYPLCLQKAHENAALAGFDLDILQGYIYQGVRESLAEEAGILDAFQIQDSDPSQRRYGW